MAGRGRILVLGTALLVSAGGCGDSDDAVEEGAERAQSTIEQATRMTATLTGSAETTPGDPDGAGTASINVDVSKGEVCFDVSLQRLDTPVGMHIHEGGTGESGPVVVPLTTPTSGDASSNGCVNADGPLITRIVANPDGFYVNVHTGPFAQGAVRGQLGRA